MAVRRLTVPAGTPPRLDAFLAKSLPGFSKVQIQRLLSDGRVLVNGKKAKPMRRIVGGETVEVDVPQAAPVKAVEGPKLRLLYENRALVVINKPSGLVVEPEGDRPSVVGIAAGQFQGFDVGGRAEPGVAHRLDKDTTGCLMLAKTDASLADMKLAFEEKRVKKTYLALVWGTPPETGKLDTPYGRHPEDPRRYTTRFPTPRRARLSWVKQEQFENVALLEIDLDTGRTHQIRAQLADIGHPLLGDWLYGNAEAKAASIGRIPLHAWKLQLDDRHFEAPFPDDLQAAVEALRAKSGRS